MTRYDPISIWEIDVGDRYGRSDVNEISIGLPIWNMVYPFGIWLYQHGHPRYRYGHRRHRCGIWANQMEDDSIDTVFSNLDRGYLVTLP